MSDRVAAFTSQKFRFFAFLAMVLLVYVHGYNLNERYLRPWSLVDEPITFTTFTEYLLSNGLFRFRIPILFIISGYLFALHDHQPYAGRIRKRLRTLLLPYLLWSAIGLGFTFLLEQWPATNAAVRGAQLGPFGDVPVATLGLGQLWVNLVVAPTPFQLWFIRCLLIYNFAYPCLRVAALRAPRVTFVIFALLWLAEFNLWLVEGEGLLFFTLGVWLCKTGRDIEARPAWLRLGPAAATWVALAVLKTWLAFQNDARWVPALVLLHKIVVAGGMVVMWHGINGAVRWAMTRRWFVWLTSFSFIIYALHVPLINYLLVWVFPRVKDVPHYRLLTFVLLPTTVTAFCVLVGATLRRLAPAAYGVLTGGRGFAS